MACDLEEPIVLAGLLDVMDKLLFLGVVIAVESCWLNSCILADIILPFHSLHYLFALT